MFLALRAPSFLCDTPALARDSSGRRQGFDKLRSFVGVYNWAVGAQQSTLVSELKTVLYVF